MGKLGSVLLTDDIKRTKFNIAVSLLNDIEIDGETAEFLLEEIGMHDQVAKQIIAPLLNKTVGEFFEDIEKYL